MCLGNIHCSITKGVKYSNKYNGIIRKSKTKKTKKNKMILFYFFNCTITII